MDRSTVTLAHIGVEEIDDPVLAGLHRQALRDEASFRSRDVLPSADPGNLFDLKIAKPHAVDVRKLYTLVGKQVPAAIAASLGPRIPVLFCHGITPFYKEGEEPTGVWGMGYEAILEGVDDAVTVAIFPGTQMRAIAKASQRVRVGLDAHGGFSIEENGLELDNASGIAVAGANVFATTHQTFALALDYSYSMLDVQSGPVGAGGARWNIYRGRNRIDVYQPLFHTALIPQGVTKLSFKIKTWVRRSGSWVPPVKSTQWNYPEQRWNVSLDGL